MVQPIDYAQLAGGFQSPQEAFANTIKLREYYLQQQKAAEDARLAKEKAIQMEADLKDYTTAPTPQKLANLHLRYPALKESLNAYTQTLSDADKKTTTEFATQAFGLNRAGKADQVLSLFDTYIKAATDSGRSDMAQVLKDSKNTFSTITDPKAREALIGSVLAGTGKEGLDLYDKIWADKEKGYVSVPGVGLFLQSDIDRAVAAADAAGQPNINLSPNIPEADVRMLKEGKGTPAQFDAIYGPGAAAKVLGTGGQTVPPSGTFQGQ